MINAIAFIKNKPLKDKIKLLAAIFVFIIGSYMVYGQFIDEPIDEDVAFGEPIENTSVINTPSNSESVEGNATQQVTKFREPAQIQIPQFNIVVELAKLIENVRNKPEALMDIQLAQAQKTLEARAKMQSFLAQEAKARLELAEAEKQLSDLSEGVTAKSKDIPINDDIDPFGAKKLLQVNYNTMDFALNNIRNTFAGKQALISYKGVLYPVSEGEYVMPKVKLVSISTNKVTLSAPDIGNFDVKMKF
ncbi:hypothetical protein OCF84_20830 (plasmid) [Shewanella xiamenensis]|uniref:Uncharacterized protein n=1 Tax=Shewanella xiamenensis TaxID=332186 RepID=A0ABT6UFN0_9GAMM|nr:hypothetical protein [Shewanella xiamenensis]MDI5833286.1 hypothetical protein [Shewanella xiamenensis]WHF57964.1 hypothetical protein OCF84_20830 [Shewanella xiamenensis]